jgi:hypothetical protein
LKNALLKPTHPCASLLLRRGSLHAHIVFWVLPQDVVRVMNSIVACVPAELRPDAPSPPARRRRGTAVPTADPLVPPPPKPQPLVGDMDDTPTRSQEFRDLWVLPTEPRQRELFELVIAKQRHFCRPAGTGCRSNGYCRCVPQGGSLRGGPSSGGAPHHSPCSRLQAERRTHACIAPQPSRRRSKVGT